MKDLREIPESLRDGLNVSGADIPAKRLVSGHENAITLTAANTSVVFGVTRNVVKNTQRGSIMLRGRAILTAGVGGIAAGVRFMPEAATGKAITWTTGNAVAGVAMFAAAADADFEGELGIGATAQ